MTVHARSDIQEVRVSSTGHVHKRKRGEEAFAVNCPACEPELESMGWTRDPTKIELTPDEEQQASLIKEKATTNLGELSEALARVAQREVREGAPSGR